MIPRNAVPEWFVASSRQCLLPGLDYHEVIKDNAAKAQKAQNVADDNGNGDGDDDKEDENAPPSRDDKAKKDPSKYQDIGAHNSCKSSVLTLSFHVKQADVIKLYLYHNGQSMRFMPEDIRDILPTLFNMEYLGNDDWLQDKMKKEVD